MKILITGICGFIGFSLAKSLLDSKINVVGIDNLNKYYSIKLKKKRLSILKKNKLLKFYKLDIKNKKKIDYFLKKNNFTHIFHLAAQPGVRDTKNFPEKYFYNNEVGFFNILNNIKIRKNTKIYYASSSSVYGDQKIYPSKENYNLMPKNIYGLTKKHNEQMAELFHKTYGLKIVGLRFFTVFGEWGRPDMLFLKFFKHVSKNKIFYLNNNGNHYRDFTHINDVVLVLKKLMKKNFNKHEIFNICSSSPRKLSSIISFLIKITKFKKIKNNKRQHVEVLKTHGSNKKLIKVINHNFNSNFNDSVLKTYNWYKFYKNLI
tara:strand:+ start:1180 stop:2133 length:954 start_codon:yes stop_codon:yes gene_type:complete